LLCNQVQDNTEPILEPSITNRFSPRPKLRSGGYFASKIGQFKVTFRGGRPLKPTASTGFLERGRWESNPRPKLGRPLPEPRADSMGLHPVRSKKQNHVRPKTSVAGLIGRSPSTASATRPGENPTQRKTLNHPPCTRLTKRLGWPRATAPTSASVMAVPDSGRREVYGLL
jgi:hypothetical protein